MNKIWLIIICFSLIYGIFTGRGEILSNTILNIPSESFNLLITMITAACFWSGIMKIMESVGIVDYIAKKIRPLFTLIMPKLKDEKALNYVSMNIAANIFGLGYAATPSGLKAIKRMQELNNGDKEEATDEIVNGDVTLQDMLDFKATDNDIDTEDDSEVLDMEFETPDNSLKIVRKEN